MRLFLFTLCFFMFSFISNGQTDTAKNIQKNLLIENNELNDNLTGYDTHFKVISYTVTAIINGYCYEIHNVGAKFSEQTIKFIKTLKSGKKIYFEDIKVRGLDGRIITMKPIVFKLK